MRVTPFFIWLISFALTCCAAVFLPAYRVLLYFLVIAHIPIFASGIIYIRLQFFGKVLYRGVPGSNTIALTFDDGPDPTLTPDILAILQKHAFKATFFVVGINVEKYPAIVKQCFDAGHTIGCHDLSHSIFSNFRITAPLIRDISNAQQKTHSATGHTPLLYRPPVGLMNMHTLKALDKLNMHCIGWSKSVRDFGNRRIKKINHIHSLAGNGEVIILHDILPEPSYKQVILDQINQLCTTIKKRKLKTVTIDEMFHIRPYK